MERRKGWLLPGGYTDLLRHNGAFPFQDALGWRTKKRRSAQSVFFRISEFRNSEIQNSEFQKFRILNFIFGVWGLRINVKSLNTP